MQLKAPIVHTKRDSEYEQGIRHFKKKRWDAALQTFQAINAASYSDAEKADIAYYLGLCYTKLERYNDALLYLEQVVTGNTSALRICQCRLMLAYIYVITHRVRLAEAELDRLLKSGFKSAQIFTMLGFSAWSQKEYEKAIGFYEQALDIDQANCTAMNGLGFILVDSNKDIKRGFDLCKKAAQRKPKSAAYLDSLGWAHFKNGDVTEARNCLRHALEIAPRHKEISAHMKAVVGNGAS